ncbi:MAG: RsmB/NOP family class I SAM-dependent RNA methyltransferase [Bdellovibrionia bacterium]
MRNQKKVKWTVQPRMQRQEMDSPPPKASRVDQAMKELWEKLLTSTIHLDSALSQLPPKLKSILAQMVPRILLSPASLAEALGVGVAPGEPWSLVETPSLARWRPALMMAQRLYESMEQKPVDVTPLECDFPPEMVQEWKKSWGEKRALELVEVLATSAPLFIRASRKVGAPAVLATLKKKDQIPVRAQLCQFSPVGVELAGYAPILKSDAYAQGWFEIQDEGSQWMALFTLWPEVYGGLLQSSPGKVSQVSLKGMVRQLPEKDLQLTVVDACAGAGGKSLALADLLKGKGRVYAYDTSLGKLQALRRRAKRAGLTNIQVTQVVDITASDAPSEEPVVSQFKNQADVVLVDAPCTGWGVLRRNPDIKWRQKKESLTRMPELQIRILSEYSKLVRPGGRLVYGVCTFRPEETTDVVKRFLKAHPEFQAAQGGYLGPGPMDGFFMQALVKS